MFSLLTRRGLAVVDRPIRLDGDHERVIAVLDKMSTFLQGNPIALTMFSDAVQPGRFFSST